MAIYWNDSWFFCVEILNPSRVIFRNPIGLKATKKNICCHVVKRSFQVKSYQEKQIFVPPGLIYFSLYGKEGIYSAFLL